MKLARNLSLVLGTLFGFIFARMTNAKLCWFTMLPNVCTVLWYFSSIVIANLILWLVLGKRKDI